MEAPKADSDHVSEPRRSEARVMEALRPDPREFHWRREPTNLWLKDLATSETMPPPTPGVSRATIFCQQEVYRSWKLR